MTATNSATLAGDREIVLTRILNAPRDLVFDVWTDPQHIAQWWGPNGFTNTIHEMNVRPGGIWRFIMHGPDGTDYPNKIVYEKVERPSLIAYLHGDDSDDEAAMFRASASFEEEEGKTKVTLRLLFPSAEARNKMVEFGAVEGGQQTLGRLEQYLSKLSDAA